jgi:thiol-disulfide isomerase/thioredoxin
MVSVDVNTGRFTGKRNQEETITETNMYAAKEVARQLRLRDIGGIIVIDFIDMENEGNRKRVQNELHNALKLDRARTKDFPISKLGLIEMSRQRVRPSLVSFLSDDCPYCKGTGKVLSLATLANRIEREVHRVFHKTGERIIQIKTSPMLGIYLLREKAEQLDELCTEHDMSIDVIDDPAMHRETFQVLSLRNDKDLLAELDKSNKPQQPRSRGNRRRPAASQASSQQPRPATNRPAANRPTSNSSGSGQRPPRGEDGRERTIIGSPRGRSRGGRGRGRGRRGGQGRSEGGESGGDS